jgi:mono/diheme cytochrome c family protein
MLRQILSAFALVLAMTGCSNSGDDDPVSSGSESGEATDSGITTDSGTGSDAPSYAADVQPIFTSRCGSCHGNAGGLSLANFDAVMAGGDSGPAVVPSDPDASLLVRRVEGTVTPRMPSSGAPLDANQIATLRAWIASGPNND